MMRFGKIVVAALATGVVVATLSGCQKQEGPAERAGKAMDSAMENAGQQMEKAGEKLQDAAKDARK
jgi:hypothetical protein